MSAPDRFQPANIRPSDEQINIQTSPLATVLVQANAGAAKTTTLALRIGQALHDGIATSEILVLTFTEAACTAMRLALAKIGVPRAAVQGIRIQTFDAFAGAVLQSIEHGRVPLRRTPEDAAVDVLEAVEECGLQVDTGFVERFLAVSRRLKGTLAFDQQVWAGAVVDESLVDALEIELPLLELFSTYEELRYPPFDGTDRPAFRCALDATYDLARLLANPEPTTYLHEMPAWPTQLSLLLVDEMHDLNLAMFTIMRGLLDSTPARFCGVGDYDQVIHTTAGAERRFMDRDVDLGERRVRIFPLTSTHRFSRSLASMASALAAKPYSSAATHATVVDHASYGGERGNAEALLVEKLEAWKAAPSARLADIAVLLRHSWQSVAIENALLARGILYQLRGFESYIMQPEVLLVRALLAVATKDFGQLGSRQTREELVRAVVFFCQIELDSDLSQDETPQERIAEAIRHVTAEEGSLEPFMNFQVLNKAAPPLARRMRAAIEIAHDAQTAIDLGAEPQAQWFDRFLDALEIRPWVKQVFVERQRQADALRYFEGLKQAAQAFDGPKAFFASLGRLADDTQGIVGARGRTQKAALDRKHTLSVALIADVKGLEFEHVVLPYLEQGVFPAELAPNPVEERNLFYVGITRARSRLTLLSSAGRPSEFVKTSGSET
jgi:DNA helicase-2/ATP-dependent DNA helicase PcrA